MPAPSPSGPPMTRLEWLARLGLLAIAAFGLYLMSNHPNALDPIRSLGTALCFFANMSNALLVMARARDELGGLPRHEHGLLGLGALAVFFGALWHVADLLRPGLPTLADPLLYGGMGIMALAFVLGIVRRSRMPRQSERPHTLMLD